MEVSWLVVEGRVDGWRGGLPHRLAMQRESTGALLLNPSGYDSDAAAAHSKSLP